MEILNQKNLYKDYFEVNRLTLKNKKNKQITRDFLRSKNAVAAVVYDRIKNKYLFVKQFRPGPQKDVIEQKPPEVIENPDQINLTIGARSYGTIQDEYYSR